MAGFFCIQSYLIFWKNTGPKLLDPKISSNCFNHRYFANFTVDELSLLFLPIISLSRDN